MASALNRTKYTAACHPVPGFRPGSGAAEPGPRSRPLRCGGEHRPRLSPLDRSRPTRCDRSVRLDDPDRRRSRVPRRRRRRDRRQRRSRAARDRRARWPTRPAGSPTPTAARSRPSRSRPTRARSAVHLPIDDPAIYPVSGGSEAIETALKLARAYHLARGEPDRWIVFARWGSYHGNTLGALDLSGRKPLRRPYEAWLGRFRHVSAAYPVPRRPAGRQRAGRRPSELADGAGPGHSRRPGRGRSPRSSRSRSSARPWPPRSRPTATGRPIAEVCRRHGVLLIADEVMTGFGRTGRWFALDHWGVRPDILVAAKGATSGYWPFGFVAASGEVYATVTRPGSGLRPRLHLLARAGRAPRSRARSCASSRTNRLVEASAAKGERLQSPCATAASASIRPSARSAAAA